MKTTYFLFTQKFLVWLGVAAALGGFTAHAQVIREGVYDGGTTKIYIKAVRSKMPGRVNSNYYGLVVSEVPGGGMLAKAYKIEERGGRQSWLPFYQACSKAPGNNVCSNTGYLSLRTHANAHYNGFLTFQAGVETLHIRPAALFERGMDVTNKPITPCEGVDFGPNGFRRVESSSLAWLDINEVPQASHRFVRGWSDKDHSYSKEAARLSVSFSSGAAYRNMDLNSQVSYQYRGGEKVFELKPGSYSMGRTIAGLGEVRMTLDDSRSRSGTAVTEPMQATAIYLRNHNKNYLLLMDAEPGRDNCNMTAAAFVQE